MYQYVLFQILINFIVNSAVLIDEWVIKLQYLLQCFMAV